LCTIPMPPSWAIAMARRASVTVSIAADTSGRFREMFRESRVAREVSLGRTWENAGTSNTSSKVSALPRRRISKLQMADCTRGPSVVTLATVTQLFRHEVRILTAGSRLVVAGWRYTGPMKLLRATLLGLACALPALSFAEWQWI